VYLTQGTADLLSSVTSGWYTAWQAHLIFWVPVLCVLANIQTYVPIPLPLGYPDHYIVRLKHMAPIALIANIAIISGIIVIMTAACFKISDNINDGWDVDWWAAPEYVLEYSTTPLTRLSP